MERDWQAMTDLGKELRRQLADAQPPPQMPVLLAARSAIDGAHKLVLGTPHGPSVETVIMPMESGHVTQCISSQIGCKMACDFCATAEMPIRADLSAAEIVEQAIESQQAILTADAATDERFDMAQSIADFQIRSLICAPMVSSEGESLGVIQIDTLNQLSRFTDQDLHILAGVSSQASIALDNANMHEEAVKQRALQRDLEVANQMQHALLPASSPEVPGYHFFEFYEAALQVGGDYYDYVILPNDRFAVIVGDVAGKGVSAAILMAKLSSDVRFWLASEPDTAKALGKINEAFSRHEWDDRFVTMVVAVVEPETHTLTLANAGHMPPLLRNADGDVIEIGGEQAGLPIGVIEDYRFEAYQRTLDPGDFVTVFTDGFSEAMNSERELYGLKKLIEVVGNKNIGSHDLGEHVLSSVRKFAGNFPQSDDMCLVCFGRD